MPSTPKTTRSSQKISTPKTPKSTPSKVATDVDPKRVDSLSNSRAKLSELSLNTDKMVRKSNETHDKYGHFDGDITLRVTPERIQHLDSRGISHADYIANNIDATHGFLEVVGSLRGKQIPESFYEKIFKPDLKIKRLALRLGGRWNSCHCPTERSKYGEQIDCISKENTTNLEHLYIMRTFIISPCALLDLISRSPNLKVLRFYGHLTTPEDDHHTIFQSVRFLSSLEGIYWPWVDKKLQLPTLRTLVSRHDQVTTFYSNTETTCELIGADRLSNVKNLSLNMNDNWTYHVPEEDYKKVIDNKEFTAAQKETFLTKKKEGRAKRLIKHLPARIERLTYLAQLQNLEALELRTYDINFIDDDDDTEKNNQITKQYETYQLKFWECVSKIRNLKYLAIYGAWDLDIVARELARHGLPIEYFRTNLMPGSLMVGIKETEAQDENGGSKLLTLNLNETTRHLVKLAKLKSVHITCFEFLANLHPDTQAALKDIGDLIWQIDCRVPLTKIVEDVLNQLLKRGNQSGRSYLLKLIVEPDEYPEKAKFYLETVQKFSATSTVKERLTALVASECKERHHKASQKNMNLWGFAQVEGRDKSSYEQLRAAWNSYEAIFLPIDRFV